MDVISHALTYFDLCEGDVKKFQENISYVLLPDAIRFYTKNREFSHFEESPFGEISYMVFPENLKDLSEEKIDEMKNNGQMFLASGIQKAAIGEETHIEKFIETNSHLSEEKFDGILNHLIQDKTYDEWIRNIFDCSEKYEDAYYDKEHRKFLNGQELRNEIRNLEIENNNYLIELIEEKYGIHINQNWINENIKNPLQKMYEEKMYWNTEKYLNLDGRFSEKTRDVEEETKNKRLLKTLNEDVIYNTKYVLEKLEWPDIERYQGR